MCTQFSAIVKIFQSDGGGECTSNKFQQYLSKHGILHHKSCPYTPEHNGLAERKHRHLVETAITLLQTAKLPNQFWFHACATASYLINRKPSASLNMQSPFQKLYNTVPEIKHLRVFGCACFPLLKPYNISKLQPKTTTCVFLGYVGQHKGFICLDIAHGKIYVARHVLFDESTFPYSNPSLLQRLKLSSASSQLHSPNTSSYPRVTFV